MRAIRPHIWTASIVLAAAACSGSSETTRAELSSDLDRDLALAQSAQLELTSARAARTQVVSAIEGAPEGASHEGDREARPTPRRQSPPAPAPSRRPAPAPEAEAPMADDASLSEAPTYGDPAETVAVSSSPEEADLPAAADDEVVLVGPDAGPEGVGTSRPRDPGGWGDGDVGGLGGGVVVRGGPVYDDDVCQYHPPVSIGRRYPGYPSGPVYGGGIGTRRGGSVLDGSNGGRTRVGGGSTIRSRGGESSAPRSMPSGGRTRGRM